MGFFCVRVLLGGLIGNGGSGCGFALCVCFLLGRFALCVCFLLGVFVGGDDGLRKRETKERETRRERKN